MDENSPPEDASGLFAAAPKEKPSLALEAPPSALLPNLNANGFGDSDGGDVFWLQKLNENGDGEDGFEVDSPVAPKSKTEEPELAEPKNPVPNNESPHSADPVLLLPKSKVKGLFGEDVLDLELASGWLGTAKRLFPSGVVGDCTLLGQPMLWGLIWSKIYRCDQHTSQRQKTLSPQRCFSPLATCSETLRNSRKAYAILLLPEATASYCELQPQLRLTNSCVRKWVDGRLLYKWQLQSRMSIRTKSFLNVTKS